MSRVNAVLLALKATTKINEKLEILENSDFPEFREVLRLALDPRVVFYMKKWPEQIASLPEPNNDIGNLAETFNVLGKLARREVTGNAAINLIIEHCSTISSGNREVLRKIIAKDLECGVGSTLVNKTTAFANTIYEWPCQLVSPGKEKVIAKMTYPAICQRKMDGCRCMVVIESDGSIRYVSRNGKEFYMDSGMTGEFRELPRGYVYDGELLVYRNGVPVSREVGNGIAQKAQKGTGSDEESESLHIVLWDMIPYDDYIFGRSTKQTNDRLDELTQIVGTSRSRIHLINSQIIDNFETAVEIFEDELQKGNEGVVVKNLKGDWEDKRVTHQFKMKAELECDLIVVGWEEGVGKNCGRLGALVCQTSDGLLQVNVGSGYSDGLRDELVPENSIGRIIQVLYNSRTRDKKTKVESLFLPRFVCFRDDKSVANSLEEVK